MVLAEYNFSNNAFTIEQIYVYIYVVCLVKLIYSMINRNNIFILVSSHSLRYIPFGSISGVFTYSIYGVYVASGYKTFPKHAAKYI